MFADRQKMTLCCLQRQSAGVSERDVMFRRRAVSCSRVKAVFGIQNAALPMIAAKERSAIPLPAASHTVPKSGAPAVCPSATIRKGRPRPKSGQSENSAIPHNRKAPLDTIYAEQSHYAEGHHRSEGCGGEPDQGQGHDEQ